MRIASAEPAGEPSAPPYSELPPPSAPPYSELPPSGYTPPAYNPYYPEKPLTPEEQYYRSYDYTKTKDYYGEGKRKAIGVLNGRIRFYYYCYIALTLAMLILLIFLFDEIKGTWLILAIFFFGLPSGLFLEITESLDALQGDIAMFAVPRPGREHFQALAVDEDGLEVFHADDLFTFIFGSLPLLQWIGYFMLYQGRKSDTFSNTMNLVIFLLITSSGLVVVVILFTMDCDRIIKQKPPTSTFKKLYFPILYGI
jgi:hypothetical protein